MRQLVSFWRISGEGSPPSQVTRERECLSVPKVICCHSAIRRHLAPQQFWGGRPPGLMVIPAFTFSNQFFSSPSVSEMPWALKRNNNNNNNNNVQFLNDLRHKITSVSADDTEWQFLFQRLSIALQRFNAILLHESFGSDVDPDL